MKAIGDTICLAVLAFFAVLLLWEPAQNFWRKHTLREGVRDYVSLREWAGGVLRILLIVALYWSIARIL